MNISKETTLVLGLLLGLCTSIKAQLNPLTAQYYQNRYLSNPAFAGFEQGVTVNAGYRSQWSKIDGGPVMQSFTAEYGGNKNGLGLNVNLDKAGLQRQSRVVGTYAYHLPLDAGNQQLHFGVSLGFTNQRLSQDDLVGNSNDPMVALYNQRETFIDGDFGIAYTTKRFKVEASLPNLKNVTKREEVKLADVATFYAAVSYGLVLTQGEDAIGLEPKAAFRGVKGMENIWDLGTQLTLVDRQVMLTALYHSTNSVSIGLGLDYKRRLLFNCFYTSQTSALNSYSNGTFELSLGTRF